MITALYIFLGIMAIAIVKYFIDTRSLSLNDLIKIKQTARQNRNSYWLREKKFRAFQMNPNLKIFKRRTIFRGEETLKFPDSIENINEHKKCTSNLHNPLTYMTPESDFVEFEPYSNVMKSQLQKNGFKKIDSIDIDKENSIGHSISEQEIDGTKHYMLNNHPVEIYYSDKLAVAILSNTRTIEIYDRP